MTEQNGTLSYPVDRIDELLDKIAKLDIATWLGYKFESNTRWFASGEDVAIEQVEDHTYASVKIPVKEGMRFSVDVDSSIFGLPSWYTTDAQGVVIRVGSVIFKDSAVTVGIEEGAEAYLYVNNYRGSGYKPQVLLYYSTGEIISWLSNVENAIVPISELAEKNKEDIGAILSSFGEQDFMYGVEWNTTSSTTARVRIGNSELHRTLPIHNMMRGCLLDDNGNVVEYLPRQSWVGQTLDGSKGQVMVEIPEHYRSFEEEGTIRRCKLSLYALPNYHKVPKMYISAYDATVQRSTNKLCSVVNTDADYRGGNNNSAWDGTYRTLLGRPATYISRTNFRKYARNRNSAATAEWNCQTYEAYKALFWLYVVEYANSNCQLAFNAEKDANGYAQGGLGNGVTTITDADWNPYFSFFPFVPCGHTDELGNGSGEVAYEVPKDDGTVIATVYANRYRGVENPFGHIWRWTDGINIRISPTEANGGDNTSKVFVADDPVNYNDSNNDGYSMRGLEARGYGYVKELIFGEFGDIIPASVGGGSTTYYADYHYTDIPTAETLRVPLFGGAASHAVQAGFVCTYSHFDYSRTSANIGSRLCFIPAKK